MDIIIQKSTDAESAYKIAEKLQGSYFDDQGMKGIKKDTTEKEFFAAFVEKSMVGFIILKEINPEVVEITYLAMDPNYQDRGIGTKLVEESLKQLGRDYKVCEVKTLAETRPDEGYEKTRNFYKKLGFIPLEIINPYPGWNKDNPCQIFIKILK